MCVLRVASQRAQNDAAFAVYQKYAQVRHFPPPRIPVQAFGGNDHRLRESSPVFDEVQGVTRAVRGVPGEGERRTVRYGEVQRGPDAELGAYFGDVPNRFGGSLDEVTGRLPQPVE